MSPVYLNPSPSSTIPFLEIKENPNSRHQLLLTQPPSLPHHHHPGSNDHHTNLHGEGLSIDFFSKQPRDQDDQLKFKLQGESSHSDGVSPAQRSGDHDQMNISIEGGRKSSYGVPSLSHHSSRGDQGGDRDLESSRSHSSKWMSSKTRMMQKMMMTSSNISSNAGEHRPVVRIRRRGCSHRLQQENTLGNNSVRQCSDCHTTTTPLWRSGPQGPKSLCNACGIRQRKARKAMAAAAAAAAAAADGGSSGTVSLSSSSDVGSSKPNNNNYHKVEQKEKGSDNKSHHLLPYKKRGKKISSNIISHSYTKKLSFEEFAWSLSSSLGSTPRVFPRDEEEAAILLMALSSGLACS